jgi:hypothetical protein
MGCGHRRVIAAFAVHAGTNSSRDLLYVTVTLRPVATAAGEQLFYQEPFPITDPSLDWNRDDENQGLTLGVSTSVYLWTDTLNVTYTQYSECHRAVRTTDVGAGWVVVVVVVVRTAATAQYRDRP